MSAPAEGNLSLAAAMVVTWRGETVAMLQLVPIVFKDFRQ